MRSVLFSCSGARILRSKPLIALGVLSASLAACGGRSSRDWDAAGTAGDSAVDGASGRPDADNAGAGGSPGEAGQRARSGGAGGKPTHTVGGSQSATRGGSPNASGGGRAGSATAAGGALPAGDGGRSDGGAPPAAGAGGAALIDFTEPPPNCTLENELLNGEQCNYIFVCEGGTHFADCERQSDGTQRCQCGTFATPTVRFIVEGVDGLDACGATARACKDERLASAPRQCSAPEADGEEDESAVCSRRAICGPELQLAPGVSARRIDDFGVRCERDGNAPGVLNHCSCLDQGDYLSENPALGEACDALLEACAAEKRPVFSGPERCIDTRVAANTEDGCWISRECGSARELAGQVILENAEAMSLNCYPTDEGSAQCTCSSLNRGWFQFDVQLDVTDLDACTNMMELCTTDPVAAPEGTVTCSAFRQLSEATSCIRQLSCTRPLKLGDVDITGAAALDVVCDVDAEDSWRCSCASGNVSETLELGNATDGQAACNAAAARCQTMVDFSRVGGRSTPLP